jgi:hypothetical protein
MRLAGYLSNQWGFSETGRILVNQVKNKIDEIGITVLDPFEICGKELNFQALEKLTYYEARVAYWTQFTRRVTPINNSLMRNSHCQFAILDGGPAVDDGVASEIGYYAALVEAGAIPQPFGRIFALRTDFRLGENIGCSVNPQIEGYIYQTGGSIHKTLDEFFVHIDNWNKTLSKQDIRKK